MKMTIKSIAKLAGVSVSTVSKIINNYDEVSEETKQKVLKIMQEHDYRPSYSAKTLATKKSNLIGVVFAGKLNIDFNHVFFVDVMNSFKKRIGLLGYDLLFFSNEKFHHSGEDYYARCKYFQVDGCIVVAGDEIEPCIYDLDQSEIPCIGIDIILKGQNSGYIMTDNSKIASKVVEHFYLQGYREIGYVGSSRTSEIANLRETSFRQSLSDFGLPIHENWFVYGTDFYEQTGYDSMKQMIAQSETLPRAIFAASDLIAIGAMRALREHQYEVPQDVAIIGCDGIDACKYTSPPLSTIRQDKEKIGKLAALMLFDLMNKQMESTSVMIEPELIIRDSCMIKP